MTCAFNPPLKASMPVKPSDGGLLYRYPISNGDPTGT